MTEISTIQVFINQVPHAVPVNATLVDAVQCAGISPPFAAAVNLQFIPKSEYANHALQPDDQIELIAPITGG